MRSGTVRQPFLYCNDADFRAQIARRTRDSYEALIGTTFVSGESGAAWRPLPRELEGNLRARPILYDLTRLSGRLFSPTPSGIDRIDFAYARHFFAKPDTPSVNLSMLGPALFDRRISGGIVDNLIAGWDDIQRGAGADDENRFRSLRTIEQWLRGSSHAPVGARAIARIKARHQKRDAMRALAVYAGIALGGRSLVRHAPTDSLYLNISQFPLWSAAYVRWLEARRDIRCVVMIHDLLPLKYPEYFRSPEYERHVRRLAFLARRGDGVIVSTSVVAGYLEASLAQRGRTDMPIHVARLPVDETFATPVENEGKIASDTPYFVAYGTIEPRKNHMMLLQLWREMVDELGETAPRLVIVGKRGWDNETVFRLFDQSIGLSRHVLEVNGLSTLELRHLLAGARGLLVPSLAEGFGLPVAEGGAAGVPVIASDIPVFREVGGPEIAYVHPLDVPGWKRAIAMAMRGDIVAQAAVAADDQSYFAGIEDFLAKL